MAEADPGMRHGKLMCVEGIVTKCGVVTPSLVQSMHVHKEEDDGLIISCDHRDDTSLISGASGRVFFFPAADSDGEELMMDEDEDDGLIISWDHRDGTSLISGASGRGVFFPAADSDGEELMMDEDEDDGLIIS
eukprot:TRINITY_DN3319_c0_g1_i2.p1 TRINITY_DN3319_c0_g1~~TRINITY_DN3319_c0_g1_i2.p1  ORF type:complete len:134 (+),score=39.71 TRINITY_DN3319_c0_g1_i2:69-470(+)